MSNGVFQESLFDANVRDYEGDVAVNSGIRATLIEARHDEEFWWLNNGVTIVATKARFASALHTHRSLRS